MKTRTDAYKVLLNAGWTIEEIEGVMQPAIDKEMYDIIRDRRIPSQPIPPYYSPPKPLRLPVQERPSWLPEIIC